MQIPKKLLEAISKEAEGVTLRNTSAAREELTDRYRSKEKKRDFITTDAHRIAYIASRMPATFAVVKTVLQEIKSRHPEFQPKTVLDLGAGPGTVMWAACEIFPSIERMTLFEKDSALASIGKRMATFNENHSVRSAEWQHYDLESVKTIPKQDLIVLSYSVGELNTSIIPALIESCWQAAEHLVIIEPGTPVGFERIRAIRAQLINLGCHMTAPCPHTLACPMSGGDWCHFSQRVERSSLHRRIKGGSLGYEDEKFSYVAVSKIPCKLPYARILRHPIRHSGHMSLTLCTADNGLQQVTISKRTPETYRMARKLDWNDAFEDKP